MTLDLREGLERATSGILPHPSVVERARSTGRRRLAARRARYTLGGAAALALLGAGVANLPVGWFPTTTPTASSAASTGATTSEQTAAVASAVRKAEAQQRCWAARELQPDGTKLVSVSATTVSALRGRPDASSTEGLQRPPWSSLDGDATAAWCTFQTPDQYVLVAATENGASITYRTSTAPIADPGPDGPAAS